MIFFLLYFVFRTFGSLLVIEHQTPIKVAIGKVIKWPFGEFFEPCHYYPFLVRLCMKPFFLLFKNSYRFRSFFIVVSAATFVLFWPTVRLHFSSSACIFALSSSRGYTYYKTLTNFIGLLELFRNLFTLMTIWREIVVLRGTDSWTVSYSHQINSSLYLTLKIKGNQMRIIFQFLQNRGECDLNQKRLESRFDPFFRTKRINLNPVFYDTFSFVIRIQFVDSSNWTVAILCWL